MSCDSDKNGGAESTFGLRLDQLADLFAVAVEEQASEEIDTADEGVANMLRHQLAAVLPGEIRLTSLAGRSFLQVLLDPESSVRQLQVVKELAKDLTRTIFTFMNLGSMAACSREDPSP